MGCKTPIMGINTDPKRSVGFLCTEKVFHETRKEDLQKLFKRVEEGKFKVSSKKRLIFKMQRGLEHCNVPVLNEVFFANKLVAGISKYKLIIDKRLREHTYYTSGIIFSTSTGSTSWLNSCK